MTATVVALAPTTPKMPTFTAANPLPPDPTVGSFAIAPKAVGTAPPTQYAYPS
jgi:hypothetical protein